LVVTAKKADEEGHVDEVRADEDEASEIRVAEAVTRKNTWRMCCELAAILLYRFNCIKLITLTLYDNYTFLAFLGRPGLFFLIFCPFFSNFFNTRPSVNLRPTSTHENSNNINCYWPAVTVRSVFVFLVMREGSLHYYCPAICLWLT